MALAIKPIPPMSGEDCARFWAKVERTAGCWPWLGSTKPGGKGRFYIGRKGYLASRVSWTISNGREPEGVVCHSCDNPKCVNPSHLWLGTQADNMRDMNAKGRNGFAKKTHCKRGHEFTPENTYLRSDGGRDCNECTRIRHLRYRAQRSAVEPSYAVSPVPASIPNAKDAR